MPWVKFDDRFPSNRKVRPLSDRAFRLYVSGVCWAAENLTDSLILDTELTQVAHVRNINGARVELEARGLWERVEGGWRIHDYHDYQPTKEQVLKDRQKNAARQEAYRKRRNGKPVPPTDGEEIESNGVTTTVTAPVSNGGSNATPSRTRPDPARTTGSTGGGVGTGGSAPAPHTPKYDGREPIPEDFRLSDAMRRWAAATLPSLDPDYETAQFISHHLADGGRRKSWPDEWQKWMRRAAKWASDRAQQQAPVQGAFLMPLQGGAQPTGTDATVAGWLNLDTSHLRESS